MKEFYKIGEISKLYNIGIDSLRYYEEIGVLTPYRDSNNYRMYGLKEMYKLSIIKELRKFNFSMEQIKNYLVNQSVRSTEQMLHNQKNLIEQEIRELNDQKRRINNHLSKLSLSKNVEDNVYLVVEQEDRFCVGIQEKITKDEEMDYVIKKLHAKHKDKGLDFTNMTIGAFPSLPMFNEGEYNVFNKVFFIIDNYENSDFILPKGKYLSCVFKGNYNQSPIYIKRIFEYAKKNNLELSDILFETYVIDNRDTNITEEFITRIEVLIK